jgi:hypothetical protein
MKKIIYSIALGALTLTNTSCYDVLDKEPLDQYTDAVVWNDPTLIDAFLVTQYMYTPVMVNDATTMFTSWSGSPMNRDDRRGDTNYFFGNSEQVFGVGLTLDVSDEAKYNNGLIFLGINYMVSQRMEVCLNGGIMLTTLFAI